MHNVCKMIHTDLKPENVVIGLTERDQFEMLFEHILNGPYFDLY